MADSTNRLTIKFYSFHMSSIVFISLLLVPWSSKLPRITTVTVSSCRQNTRFQQIHHELYKCHIQQENRLRGLCFIAVWLPFCCVNADKLYFLLCCSHPHRRCYLGRQAGRNHGDSSCGSCDANIGGLHSPGGAAWNTMRAGKKMVIPNHSNLVIWGWTNQKPAKMGMDVMKGMIIVECNGISNQYVSWTSLKLRCRPPTSWQFYFS